MSSIHETNPSNGRKRFPSDQKTTDTKKSLIKHAIKSSPESPSLSNKIVTRASPAILFQHTDLKEFASKNSNYKSLYNILTSLEENAKLKDRGSILRIEDLPQSIEENLALDELFQFKLFLDTYELIKQCPNNEIGLYPIFLERCHAVLERYCAKMACIENRKATPPLERKVTHHLPTLARDAKVDIQKYPIVWTLANASYCVRYPKEQKIQADQYRNPRYPFALLDLYNIGEGKGLASQDANIEGLMSIIKQFLEEYEGKSNLDETPGDLIVPSEFIKITTQNIHQLEGIYYKLKEYSGQIKNVEINYHFERIMDLVYLMVHKPHPRYYFFHYHSFIHEISIFIELSGRLKMQAQNRPQNLHALYQYNIFLENKLSQKILDIFSVGKNLTYPFTNLENLSKMTQNYWPMKNAKMQINRLKEFELIRNSLHLHPSSQSNACSDEMQKKCLELQGVLIETVQYGIKVISDLIPLLR